VVGQAVVGQAVVAVELVPPPGQPPATGFSSKAVDGHIVWDEALFSYRFGDPTSRNDADSAPFAMTSVVANPFFDWSDDRPLRIPSGAATSAPALSR
jgi:hypothetical protein